MLAPRRSSASLDLLRASRHAVLAELGARLATFVMTVADERRAEGRLGFHDLLVHARRVLRHDRGAAASLRLRYRRLLIDEFQDTDPIQVELAARIVAAVDGSADLRDAEPGGLFVVGDPKQSIYRFRRADIALFSRVSREIGEHIVLGTNFRSVPGILAFVNTVFAQLFGAEPVPGQAAHHELTGERGSSAPAHPVRHAQRPGSLIDGGGPDGGPGELRCAAVAGRAAVVSPRRRPRTRRRRARRAGHGSAPAAGRHAPRRGAGRPVAGHDHRGPSGRRPRRGRHHRRHRGQSLGRHGRER